LSEGPEIKEAGMTDKRKKISSGQKGLSSILDRGLLRSLAGEAYFKRGLKYFDQGRVLVLNEFDGNVSAIVSGSEDYAVRLRAKNGQLEYLCSCPLGVEGEFCKHCVAAGLEFLAGNKDGAKTTSEDTAGKVREYLSGLEKSQLVEMIMEQAGNDLQFQKRLELKLAVGPDGKVDVQLFKSFIQGVARDLELDDSPGASACYRKLDNIIGLLEGAVENNGGPEIIELAEYFLEEMENAMLSFDCTDDNMFEIMDRLEDVYYEACEKNRPDTVELAERLHRLGRGSLHGLFMDPDERYADLLGEKGLEALRKLEQGAEHEAEVPATEEQTKPKVIPLRGRPPEK